MAKDWEEHYGHPVVLAETFVDSHLFKGTCYKAAGWIQLGEEKLPPVMVALVCVCVVPVATALAAPEDPSGKFLVQFKPGTHVADTIDAATSNGKDITGAT